MEACPVYVRHREKSLNERESITKKLSILSVGLQSAGRGERTGVELKYYDYAEYQALTPEKKEEHRQWMRTSEGQAEWTKMRKAAKGGRISSTSVSKSETRNKKRKQKAVKKAVGKELKKIQEQQAAQIEEACFRILDAGLLTKKMKVS